MSDVYQSVGTVLHGTRDAILRDDRDGGVERRGVVRAWRLVLGRVAAVAAAHQEERRKVRVARQHSRNVRRVVLRQTRRGESCVCVRVALNDGQRHVLHRARLGLRSASDASALCVRVRVSESATAIGWRRVRHVQGNESRPRMKSIRARTSLGIESGSSVRTIVWPASSGASERRDCGAYWRALTHAHGNVPDAALWKR